MSSLISLLVSAFFLSFLTVDMLMASGYSPTALVYHFCDSDFKVNGTLPPQANEQQASLVEKFIHEVIVSLSNPAPYKNFTLSSSAINGTSVTLYGLYQCREDYSSLICKECVTKAANDLQGVCPDQHDGEVQLAGCYIKYDFSYFFGIVDFKEMMHEHSDLKAKGSDPSIERGAVLMRILRQDKEYFRRSNAGLARGIAQCVHDLTLEQCQTCLFQCMEVLTNDEYSASIKYRALWAPKCYAMFEFLLGDREKGSAMIKL